MAKFSIAHKRWAYSPKPKSAKVNGKLSRKGKKNLQASVRGKLLMVNVSKHKTAPNPLKMDPTRMFTLRRQFSAEFDKRFEALKAAVTDLVVKEDAFGLSQTTNVFCPTGEGGGIDSSCKRTVDRTETLDHDGPDFPVGARRVGKDSYVDEMQAIPVGKLSLTPGNRLYSQSVQRYVDHPSNKRPLVFLKDGKYSVDDGNHRIAADKKLGLKSSKVWVRLSGATANQSLVTHGGAGSGNFGHGGRPGEVGGSGSSSKTDSLEFKKWFGDSKVVNADGMPLVVFHGSMHEFDQYKTKPEDEDKWGMFDRQLGTHFAEDPDVPSTFTVGQYAWPTDFVVSDRPGESWYREANGKLNFDGIPVIVQEAKDGNQTVTPYDPKVHGSASWGLRDRLGDNVTARIVPVGGNIQPVFLSIKNPLVVEPQGRESDQSAVHRVAGSIAIASDKQMFVDAMARTGRHETAEEIWDTLHAGKEYNGGEYEKYKSFEDVARNFPGMLNGGKAANSTRDTLQKMGYDGILYRNTSTNEVRAQHSPKTWIAFEPTQIKSAIGNSGTFDPSDPITTHANPNHDNQGRFATNPMYDAMRKVEIGANRGALVSIRDLRKQFVGMTKGEFDQVMLAYAKLGQVSLHRHDYVAPLSPEELATDTVYDKRFEDGGTGDHAKGTYYIGAAIRQPETNSEVTANTRFQFHSTPEKVLAFRKWLSQQVQYHIIGVTQDQINNAWWRQYIQQGFEKGARRAFEDVRKPIRDTAEEGGDVSDFYQGTKAEFLRSSFGQPESIDKVKLTAGRVFSELEGVTDAMSQQMTRSLVDGLVQGKHPRDIAKDMNDRVDKIGITRAQLIAGTEMTRAHAQGQLMAMRRLGVEKLGVRAEFSTSGQANVCPICADLEGTVYTLDEAEGLIPVHPRCHCSFIPAGVGEDDKDSEDADTDEDDNERGDEELTAIGDAAEDKEEADEDGELENNQTANFNPSHDEKGKFSSAAVHDVVSEMDHKSAEILLSQGVRPDFKRDRMVTEYAPGAGLERGGLYVSKEGASSKGSFGNVRLHLSVPEENLEVPQEMKQLGYAKGKEVAGEQSLDYVMRTENGAVTTGELPPSAFNKVEVYRDGKWETKTPADYLKDRVVSDIGRLPSAGDYESVVRKNADKWFLGEDKIQQTVSDYNRAGLREKHELASMLTENYLVTHGGLGSGNFGHSGRVGEVGGSIGHWAESASVLAEPGTTPIPKGHIRAYHYSNRFGVEEGQSMDDAKHIIAEKLRTEGLDIGKAVGSAYQEPDVVWASTEKPSDQHVYAEFHVAADDFRWGLGKPEAGIDPRAFEKRESNFYFKDSIKPEEIIAVHEPWHAKARYMQANPEVLAKARAGEHDDLLESEGYGPAIRHAKATTNNYDPDESRDDQGRWTSGGTATLTGEHDDQEHETRGQNSWVNYGPHGEANRTASSGTTVFADQKTGLLPDWVVSEGSGHGLVQNWNPVLGWYLADNVFCATGDGGGVDPSCGKGNSVPTSATELLKHASDVKFTDDVIDGSGVEIGRHDYDAIEGVMTSEELDDMNTSLQEMQDSAIDDYIDNQDRDADINEREVAEGAGYSQEDVRDGVTDLVNEHVEDEEENERLLGLVDSKYDELPARVYGLDAFDELNNALGPVPRPLQDALDEYREIADTKIEEARDTAIEQWKDSRREDLINDYDSSSDRHEYLYQFQRDHKDETRFTGGPEDRVEGIWGKDSDGDRVYNFSTKSGTEYQIDAYERDSYGLGKVTNIAFNDADGKYEITGSGNALDVFRNVSSAVAAFANKEKPDVMAFTAAEPSRQKLYDRLVKTVAKSVPDYAAIGITRGGGGVKQYIVAKRDKMPDVIDKAKDLSAGLPYTLDVLANAAIEIEHIEPEFDPKWFTEVAWKDFDKPVDNVFCATGVGGGIDSSCGAHPGSEHGSSVTVKLTKKRAFNGEPVELKTQLTKQETGRVGEAVALAYLRDIKGFMDAKPMNTAKSNFPIDLIEDHAPTEIKAGLASNSAKAQQWRLTFSKESKSEKAAYEKMSLKERTTWNHHKQERIRERKEAVLKQIQKETGMKAKPRTITTIINPDTKTADIYVFKGFHDRIGFNSDQARAAYVGSVTYAAK